MACGVVTQNIIDHEVLYGLDRFIASHNLVITDRQRERQTPPITLSTEATRSHPATGASGDPVPGAETEVPLYP